MSNNRGFTLLEIVLALAILAGALAALGEVMRLSDQTAQRTGDETEAQVLADSLMAELESGARPLTAVDGAELVADADPPWVYSVALEPTQYNELLMVRVVVEQQLPKEQEPTRFQLVRWIPNPDYLPTTTTADAPTSATSATDSADGTSGADSSSAFSTSGGQSATGGGRP